MTPGHKTTSTATPHDRSFAQHRMHTFGLTLMVMGGSFGLYYLGLFGGVEGPLAPERIGDRLAAMGFSGRHLFYAFLLLTGIAATWNWMYNGTCRVLKHSRRSAVKKGLLGHFVWITFLVFSVIVYAHLP